MYQPRTPRVVRSVTKAELHQGWFENLRFIYGF